MIVDNAAGTATVANTLVPYAPQAGEVGVLNANYPIGDLRRYGGSVGGSAATNTTALNNATTSANATGNQVYVIGGSYSVNTASSGSDIFFGRNGRLVIQAGQTLTLSGRISSVLDGQNSNAPILFSTATGVAPLGTVVISNVFHVFATWFGAGIAAADNTACINAAIAALSTTRGVVEIAAGMKWQPANIVSPTGATSGIILLDYSEPAFPKTWLLTYAGEQQIVGGGLPPDENNGGPNTSWNNRFITGKFGDPHAPGYAVRFGVPGASGFPGVPYNLWQKQWGNWGNAVLTGGINATSDLLTVTTNQFVAGDVGRIIKVAGAGGGGTTLTTTVLSYVSATQVHLTLAASTTVVAGNVFFVNADDMVDYSYQGAAVYGGTARVDPTSPGTQRARRIWGQNGVIIYNPTSNVNFGFDPIAAQNLDYVQVFNPLNIGGSTTRLVVNADAAGGAAGWDLRAGSDAKRKRIELVESTNKLRVRNAALSATILELDDSGNLVPSGFVTAPGSVIATGSLPAGSATMDGTTLIEQAAGPTLNAIVYGNGIRARCTGVVF